MATVNERATAAIVGSLVADAAAQPIHWIYNLGKLKTILSNLEHPEFRSPSANPYYRIDTGRNTCYGDQVLTLLESLVNCQGLDTKDYARRQYECYGPDSEYENDGNKAYVLKSGVPKNFPIHAPWRNCVIKDFLEKYQSGAHETGGDKINDMHAVIQIVPVVALYAGRPEMLLKVKDAVSVTMMAEESIVHSLAAARILEYYILNGIKEGDVFNSVLAQLRDPNRNSPQSLDNAVISFLLKVQQNLHVDHFEAATKVFKNN